jgi:hypothetical protein
MKKVLQSNCLPTEFFKWCEIAADRNQWRAISGSKMTNATKVTPTSSRQVIWAELRYGAIPIWVRKLTRKFQMSKQNEQKERKIYIHSQTSRLENPEELKLLHNHESFLFWLLLLLFAQCKMYYRWLVTWLDLTPIANPRGGNHLHLCFYCLVPAHATTPWSLWMAYWPSAIRNYTRMMHKIIVSFDFFASHSFFDLCRIK